MKKFLKKIGDNGYSIIGVIFIIMAAAHILAGAEIGAYANIILAYLVLILEKVDRIKVKIDAMEKSNEI